MTLYATPEEFFQQFQTLPADQMLALEIYAHRCIEGTRYTCAMDVIHEAVVRVLDEQRHWPRDVDLAAFLAGCVKSIVSNDRRRTDFRHASLDAVESKERGHSPLFHEVAESAEDVAMRRQRQAMSQDAIEFARRLLVQDFDGMRVLNGMVADVSPKDMKMTFEMDDKTYIAARQRVVNRLKIWAQRHPEY